MQIDIEYTDTFSGEANYSWVKRSTVEMPEKATNRMILRRAKKEMQLSGMQGVTSRSSDMISFKPYGSCTILFVTFGGQMYCVHLIKENGQGSYLSVKGRTEWKTKRTAQKHCADIQFVINRCGNFAGNVVANVEVC